MKNNCVRINIYDIKDTIDTKDEGELKESHKHRKYDYTIRYTISTDCSKN